MLQTQRLISKFSFFFLVIALLSCGDDDTAAEDSAEKPAAAAYKSAVTDPKIVDEIHAKLLAALPEYETKEVKEMPLDKIREIHTFFNIDPGFQTERSRYILSL